ncbi:hypothetical protein AVEN_121187-1 [Araneus ventricosus]|uniref:Uncharacterized protein n=1 Tax=Araneus ventricosus TaxID=182803 RepID=A0A4Y2KBU8_ARAVE|nr:hypothetical protein AVEN_121187-1 [Araneus ventricosus]
MVCLRLVRSVNLLDKINPKDAILFYPSGASNSTTHLDLDVLKFEKWFVVRLVDRCQFLDKINPKDDLPVYHPCTVISTNVELDASEI